MNTNLTAFKSIQLSSQLAQVFLMYNASGELYWEIELPKTDSTTFQKWCDDLLNDLVLPEGFIRNDNLFTFTSNRVNVWISFKMV